MRDSRAFHWCYSQPDIKVRENQPKRHVDMCGKCSDEYSRQKRIGNLFWGHLPPCHPYEFYCC